MRSHDWEMWKLHLVASISHPMEWVPDLDLWLRLAERPWDIRKEIGSRYTACHVSQGQSKTWGKLSMFDSEWTSPLNRIIDLKPHKMCSQNLPRLKSDFVILVKGLGWRSFGMVPPSYMVKLWSNKLWSRKGGTAAFIKARYFCPWSKTLVLFPGDNQWLKILCG